MKGRAFQSNRLACREREGVSVDIVVGLVLAVLVAGIPVGAEATDVATTAKSGEIPQGAHPSLSVGPGPHSPHPETERRPEAEPHSPGSSSGRHPAADLLRRAAALRRPRLLELRLGPTELRHQRVDPGLLQLRRRVDRAALRASRLYLGLLPALLGPRALLLNGGRHRPDLA